VDSVGADEKVSRRGAAVLERRHYAVALRPHVNEPFFVLDAHPATFCLVAKGTMQRRAADRGADRPVVALRTVRDLAEALATRAPHDDPRRREPLGENGRPDLERPQRLEPIRRDVQERAGVVDRARVRLVHDGLDLRAKERYPDDRPADAATATIARRFSFAAVLMGARIPRPARWVFPSRAVFCWILLQSGRRG
jgi:hypothetical protein